MFKRLKIKNFRGINDLIIEPLKSINVFVGDNMVGKTAVLDAIFIAVNPLDTMLPFRTNKFRNIDYMPDISQVLSFFRYFNIKRDIFISLDGDERKRVIKISPKLKISEKTNFNRLLDENEMRVIKNEISSTTENRYNISGFLESFVINGKKYKSTFEIIGPNLVESKGDPKFRQDLKGRYLTNVTFNNKNLCEIYSIVVEAKRKNELLFFLREFKKSIKDINLVSLRDGNKLLVEDSDFKEPLDINYYGTGLTKAVYIYSTFLAQFDDIVLIDEIENGLFFTRQKIIWSAINQIVKLSNIQYFITTHSLDMIKNLYDVAKEDNFLDRVSLFRLEKVNKENQCIYYSKEQFDIAMRLDLETRG